MKKFYVVIICIALCNCKPQELTPAELQSFILDEENGLQQSAASGGAKVSVTYRPTDLWVDQEIDGEIVDRPTLDSLRKKYAGYYYFVLTVSNNEKEALHSVGDMETYSRLVETMSFRMPQYVTLTTTSQDTIPVGDFVLNRTYGLGSSTDILFAFNKEKIENNEWVQFNLNEFGLALGNQRFRFATSDLEDVPRVHFSMTN
jgi:hypothetical protein